MEHSEQVPTGIGGWLILPTICLGLGMASAPVIVARSVFLGAPFVSLANVLIVMIAVSCGACLYGIAERRRWARASTMSLFAALAAFGALGIAGQAMRDGITLKVVTTLVRIVLEVAVILYFAYSKRVRATLIR